MKKKNTEKTNHAEKNNSLALSTSSEKTWQEITFCSVTMWGGVKGKDKMKGANLGKYLWERDWAITRGKEVDNGTSREGNFLRVVDEKGKE